MPHILHWDGIVQHSLYAPEISDMGRMPHTLHWDGIVQHSLYAPEISDMAADAPYTALRLVQLVERQIRQRLCDRV
jgi:hypothetical protein